MLLTNSSLRRTLLAACAPGALLASALAQEPSPESTPAAIPKESLDAAGVTVAAAAESAVKSLPASSWLQQELFWGIPTVRIATTIGLLLLVAILAGGLSRIVRLRSGRIKSPHPQSWAEALFSAARKPLALLIWAYGSYFALIPSLTAITDESSQALTLRIASRLADIGGIIAIFLLALRIARVCHKKLVEWAASTSSHWNNLVVEIIGRILRLSLPLLAGILLLPLLYLPDAAEMVIQKAAGMLLIAGVATLVIRSTMLFEKALLADHKLDATDNLQARKIYTQVSVIRKIIVVTVIVVAAGCMLMMFAVVRQLGTSILASAGIAGIVLGLAAQKTLGNLLAGIQIAISQPIRIDDVVIVEGEWGRIEEITLTYVVVKIWDLRRLVLPITYFIEKPFQNWTRQESKILGTVFLYLDYGIPVEEVRTELRRLCEASEWWDRDVCGLQVTDSRETTLELRCLASASDASRAWNLRCELREKLVAFIAERYPDRLPRIRAEVTGNLSQPA